MGIDSDVGRDIGRDVGRDVGRDRGRDRGRDVGRDIDGGGKTVSSPPPPIYRFKMVVDRGTYFEHNIVKNRFWLLV